MSDRHVDVAFDDEEEQPVRGGTLVDDELTGDDSGRSGHSGWRPVVPAGLSAALSSWAGAWESVRYLAGVTGYRVAFHTVRAPWYALQTLWWAVVGVFVVIRAHLRWWWVSEQHTLREQAVAAGDADAWYRLHRELIFTRATRGRVMATEALTAAAAGLAGWAWAPWWLLTPLGVVAVVLLARVGRPPDRSILSTAVVTPRYRRINPDIVLRAYYAAGLGHPDRPGQEVSFASTMSRTTPPGGTTGGQPSGTTGGSQVVIDLPYGKGFGDAVKAKGAIASGLDVSTNQVFLTRDPTSNRRHVLYVADRDPLTAGPGGPVRTPLLDGKVRDIWTDAPLGTDERGRRVGLSLLWISVLIAGQPRKGKTFAARLLALFAALDPYVTLVVVDGKMSADWDKFRLVAHRYVCGVVPNMRDHDPITHFLAVLREIKQHIERVNEILSGLPTSECPEGKLTRTLARTHPELRVWMLVMEEFQNYYETDDQDVNKEIAGLLAFIQAVGPSAGVIIEAATQKPAGIGAGDVVRLFNRFRDNIPVRLGLKLGNRTVSEVVLGGDAHAEGFDASTLPAGLDYRGVGILYGASDTTRTVRTDLADHADAETILTAARRHRQLTGTLSGDAAGQTITEEIRETRDVLADVRAVFAPSEPGLHWITIAARLAEQMPEYYTGLTADATSALLRPYVRSVGVKVNGVNRHGCRRAHLDTAINAARAARNQPAATGTAGPAAGPAAGPDGSGSGSEEQAAGI